MTESFNSILGDHRARTYLQLLEYIRRMIMRRFQQRMEDCVNWKSDLPPTVNSKILKASKESRILRMLSAGNGEYELLGETRAYMANGVPCSHVMAGISHISGVNGIRDKVVEFVDPSLSKTAFIKTYGSIIHPILDQCVRSGKPKLQRKKEQNEKPKEARSGSMICKICKKVRSNSDNVSSSQPHSQLHVSPSQPQSQLT
ncbi:hypothetical protein ACOSQ4_017057 [Xanthoceras sorbifolium]